jgi:hypothetical protein
MHYSSMEKMRLRFIDSDLLYRRASFQTRLTVGYNIDFLNS